MTSDTYGKQEKSKVMLLDEKEAKIAEIFLRTFDEKSPLDYDILDSMFKESKNISPLVES
ncbi:MAG: hypothetical protein ACO2Y5_07890 [Nitrosopumilaceae archaeon]